MRIEIHEEIDVTKRRRRKVCLKVEDFLKFDSNRMYRNLFNCWIIIDKSRVSSCHLRYEIETRSKEEGIGIDLSNRYFKKYLHEYFEFVTGNRSMRR